MEGAITFGFALSAPPVAHFIRAGVRTPPGCSGTSENPGAAPGHLCVFEVSHINVNDESSDVYDPSRLGGAGAASRFGGVVFTTSSESSGNIEDSGTWAVTAP